MSTSDRITELTQAIPSSTATIRMMMTMTTTINDQPKMVSAIEEAIQRRLDMKTMRLVVDLSALSYIASAGINVLGHTVAQYEKVEGHLCYVLPASEAQRKFFHTIGIDRLCPWADTLNEALERVGPGDKSPGS